MKENLFTDGSPIVISSSLSCAYQQIDACTLLVLQSLSEGNVSKVPMPQYLILSFALFDNRRND